MIKWIKEWWARRKERKARKIELEQNREEIELVEKARWYCMVHLHFLRDFRQILDQLEDDEEQYHCQVQIYRQPGANFKRTVKTAYITGKHNAYYVVRYLALKAEEETSGFGVDWVLKKSFIIDLTNIFSRFIIQQLIKLKVRK